jgi:recombination protein RecA
MPRGRANARTTHARTVQEIAAQINASLGPDTIGFGSDSRFVVTHLPTGVLPVDVLLDGGLPRGRFTEFFGDFSTLKSYIALCAIASCQAEGGSAMLVDTEHSFDPEWGRSCGLVVDDLIIQHPETGEEAVDAVQIGIVNGIDLVVWDSIAATQPGQESTIQLSGDKNIQPARLAALMSVGIRRLNASNKQTAVLCINQTRMKVGMVFGNPETTPGGKTLPFYSSYRVRFTKAGRLTETRKVHDGEKWTTVKDVKAQKIRAELIKSKLSVPEKEVWFQWSLVTSSIDEDSFLASTALEHGLSPTYQAALKSLTSTKTRSRIRGLLFKTS